MYTDPHTCARIYPYYQQIFMLGFFQRILTMSKCPKGFQRSYG